MAGSFVTNAGRYYYVKEVQYIPMSINANPSKDIRNTSTEMFVDPIISFSEIGYLLKLSLS